MPKTLTFGIVTHDDNDFDRNKIDSNANAVVLKEFGTSHLSKLATGQEPF